MDGPLILVCNDDGIAARGLHALASAMTSLGTVAVVAPADEQSAVGHAITLRSPVRARPVPLRLAGGEPYSVYAVTGTPADCVKIAVDKLLPRKPDLVVSGINHGANTSVNVLYSGTVSAATEAAILGIDAVAFSLCGYHEQAEFDISQRVATSVAEAVLGGGLPPGVLLNVNIPPLGSRELRGAMITRQARARWEEEFEERTDPFNESYYWLTGRFVNLDRGPNTDLWAIDNGFVSITPIQHDLTAHLVIEELDTRTWFSL